MIIDELKKIKDDAVGELEKVENLKDINEIKVRVFGKSGLLTALSKGIKELPIDQRPLVGAKINDVRIFLQEKISEKEFFLEKQELENKLANEKIDITEPGKDVIVGALHPINDVIDKLTDICVSMGFSVVEGPEIESDYYNFEAMNISQTSAVQAREMEKRKPPFKIVCPGKTYRNDSDATHSPIFNQLEGLVVDENVSMADLKSMLTILMKRLFGEDTAIRFRPSFFPFTEPSIEVDVSCPNCHGKGCSTCKGTGMLELLGAGIVNPKVLEMSGINSKKYKGFAFGFGLDRTAMILDSINNIKNLYRNDIRFLSQFK